MERPSSTLAERPAKKFKPNSFNVDSFNANFHRNPAKSIQIIPKMSRVDLKKFIKLNGLRHLTESLQANKNEKEIISLLHYKKIPFDVEIFQTSGLGEEVFKISVNEEHPLHHRASNLVKRWKKKAKNKRKNSRSRSPEEKLQQIASKKKEEAIIPKRNRIIKFTSKPEKVNYNPDHPVAWFRKLTDPRTPRTVWSLPPSFNKTYKPPQSTLFAEEEKRCQTKVIDKPSDTPEEKYKQMYIFPTPLEIDGRDYHLMPSIVTQVSIWLKRYIKLIHQQNYIIKI